MNNSSKSRLSLPPPITTTVPKSIPSPMAYSPIVPSPNQPAPPTYSAGSNSTAEYISASQRAAALSTLGSSSLNPPVADNTSINPSISQSQSYSSGLTLNQQQQARFDSSQSASMNPYLPILEEPTGSPARHYPHRSYSQSNKPNSGHYRHPSLQLGSLGSSPVSNSNASTSNNNSAAALERTSYGSASSLMSFDDNTILPSSLSTNAISSISSSSSSSSFQQNRYSPNRLHFNPHSSPRLQTNQHAQTYSTLDSNAKIGQAPNNIATCQSKALSSSLSSSVSSGNMQPTSQGSSWVSPVVTPLSNSTSALVPGSIPGSANLKPLSVDTTPKPNTTKHLLSPLFPSQQQQYISSKIPPPPAREDPAPPKPSQASSPQIYYQKSSRQSMSAQQSALMAATSQHRIPTSNSNNAAGSSNSMDLPQSDAYFRKSTGSSNSASASSLPYPSSAGYYASGAPPMLSRSSSSSIAALSTIPATNSSPLNNSALPIAQPTAVFPVPPSFRWVSSKSELNPVIHDQPKFRRALPEGGTLSPLAALTKQLSTTYHICNPEFNYQSSKNPRRILTKPSEGTFNNGYDNADSDYILYVNDILGVDEKRRYLVLDILGHGTFGQVAKCQNMITKEILAVKVIKSKPAYLKQSMMEVSILDHLNNQVDKNNEHNLLRLKDQFMHKEHLCLVFELLSSNLYELIKRNQFRGLSTGLVRVFAQQLLDSLKVLKDAKIIHCDLKPENILLKSLNSPVIKVIDFGSACHERQTVYTYIQSRFYRSPEVLLGLPYTSSIDMWSLGCIVAELFLGLPIFPGTSEYNQMSRIVDTLGVPPNWMVEMGKASFQFMEMQMDEYGRKKYTLKSREKYSEEFQTKEEPSKQYFPSTNLDEIIMNYPLPRQRMGQQDIQKERCDREAFLDFVKGLLNMNPFERWTPQQAAMHPFITEKKYTGPFVPNQAMKSYRERANQPNSSPATANPGSASASNGAINNNVAGSANMVTRNPSCSKPQSHQAPLLTKNDAQPKMYYGSTGSSSGSNAFGDSSTSGLSSLAYGPSSTTSQKNVGYQQHNQPTMHMAQPPSSTQSQAPAQHIQKPPQQQQFQQRAAAASSWTTRRPRASTIGNMDPIPPPIKRATALMNPSQHIRTQNSPAYFPPPELAEGAQQLHNNNHLAYAVNSSAATSYSGASAPPTAYSQQAGLNVSKVRQPATLSAATQPQARQNLATQDPSNNGQQHGDSLLGRQQNSSSNTEGDIVRNLEKASVYWN